MKTCLVEIVMLLFLASACTSGRGTAQKTTTIPAERVQAILCDIDKQDYQSAEKRLESLRESDPKNSEVRKLLAAVQGKMIKTGDKSAENIARVRKAIASYSQLPKEVQLSAEEKKEVDSAILQFYSELGDEEQKKELLTRASDSNRTSSERVDALAVLAGKSWGCSYKITSSKSSKDAAEIAKAKACVSEGLGYSNQALTIDPEDAIVSSYKTNLLKEAATIADLEGRQTEKVSYQKQYDETQKRTAELSKKADAAKAKESPSPAEDSFTLTQAEQASKDLIEFKAENSLDKVVAELLPVQVELTSLFGGSNPAESTPSGSQSTLAQQKHDWKTLTAAEDLTIDLPDDVGRTEAGYAAGSDGVVYLIMSMNRTDIQADPAVADRIMNTLARTYTGLVSGRWLDSGLGKTFELKFLRKETVNGEPRKLYAYALGSCTESKEGVLVVQASQAHFYTIDITGANDSDPKVQRLLSSIKVK